MTVAVDVTLPPGWYPLAPVPGILLAAVASAGDGAAVATLVVRMESVPALTDAGDAMAVAAAIPRAAADTGVREVRWCAPGVVAVLAAARAPGADVSDADLAAALRQTAVYAVDSTGSAISASSAGDANAGCRGNTRTV